MLIVLSPDQAGFYEHLRCRQEGDRVRVILDRRRGERRNHGNSVTLERRRAERRAPTPEAARALMSVLGFMVLHRDGSHWLP